MMPYVLKKYIKNFCEWIGEWTEVCLSFHNFMTENYQFTTATVK